jgi:DNA-binding PadR family transcriptional regulator
MLTLTELDLCVLGVIWEKGPLSTYRVRKRFSESATAAWSSSAGSIYPSIRRLIRAGLVLAGSAKDERGTRHVAITAKGRARLRRWLVDFPPELGSATPDPIRTRAQFLESLPHGERRRFIQQARDTTMKTLRELERVAKADSGIPDRASKQIGTLGSIFELRGRLKWLDQVLVVLGDA